jgi:hypothetical protein
VVAYNIENNYYTSWVGDGVRYVSSITIDHSALALTFTGQNGLSFVLNYTEYESFFHIFSFSLSLSSKL